MANKPYYDIGVHMGEVISQGLTKASTGTAQFILRVKILGVPDGTNYVAHSVQYERSIYMALTEKTMQYVVPKLQQLGFTGQSISQLDPSHPHHQSFVGNQVDLWCAHENDDKGGVREKWNISRPQSAMEITPLDSKQVRELDSLFGRALRQAGTPVLAGGATKINHENEPLGITDDDIPF
jgi:hypothetical protein